MARYNDIKLGDKAEILHQITQQDIEKFVELTGVIIRYTQIVNTHQQHPLKSLLPMGC